jgi:signal transduction histidine kinase
MVRPDTTASAAADEGGKPTQQEKFAATVLPLLDGMAGLMTSRELEMLLEDGLRLALQIFEAEAGSLLFQVHGEEPRSFRLGDFRPEALEQVILWERAISGRLSSAIWRLARPGLPPITSYPLPEGDLCMVSSPLISHTRVIGSLCLIFDEDRMLTMPQRQMLARLARGLGSLGALLEEFYLTRRRLSQLGLFYQVGQSLATTIDLYQLLEDIMELAASVMNSAASSLMLIDKETNQLIFEVTHGSGSEALRQEQIRIGLDEGIAGWVATHCQSVVVNDVTQDPRFSRRVDVRTGFLTRSIAAVPLQVKGQIIGVLEVLNKNSEEGFDDEDLQIMSTIAAQAAIAIENARLLQSVREEKERTIRAEESIRHEVARNLHDGPVQLLAAISMGLNHLEQLLQFRPEAALGELSALHKLARQATREARLVLFQLRPVILETQGLIPTLRTYVEQLNETEKFTTHLAVDREGLPLVANVAATIFAITQEAVNNAKKHASPHNIWLELKVADEVLSVEVRDDGLGFDPVAVEQDYDRRGSFGLLNMRERAEMIGGTLTITSKKEPPNQGTRVRLEVPLQVEE